MSESFNSKNDDVFGSDSVVDIVSTTSVVRRRSSRRSRSASHEDLSKERTRRKSETEQLKSLNDGLVGYVNNVHELEHTIEILKTENNLLWKKCKESEPKVDIKAIFENHIKNISSEVDRRAILNKELSIDHLNITKELEDTLSKIESVSSEKDVLSKDIKTLRKEVDILSIKKEELQARIYVLEKQRELENDVHKAEVENLTKALNDGRKLNYEVIKVESIKNPDISDLIGQSRNQFIDFSTKNTNDLVEYYKGKLERLNTQIGSAEKDMFEMKKEQIKHARYLGSISYQVNPLKRQTALLEENKTELEEKLKRASKDTEDEIEALRLKLTDTKHDLGEYLKQYQDLMIAKLGLDQEIAIYQGLLASDIKYNITM